MYIAAKAFFTIKHIELIKKKEFVVAVFDSKNKTFIVYIASFTNFDNDHPSCKAQIAWLKVDKAPTTIWPEYSNFANVFSPELVIEFLKHIGINNYTINFINSKQLSYGPIYNLGLV